ncbi:hypothetical protein MTR67_035842 [Solanum verrucosum]|uniref:Uncharacterized protein n=1 Tax=Solanum verrucosum TaxID=315347 RepID=A0AAF0UAM0_SOLVR|nr:hypothetical protein MTR67_035842 [Solanum verrucosum]
METMSEEYTKTQEINPFRNVAFGKGLGESVYALDDMEEMTKDTVAMVHLPRQTRIDLSGQIHMQTLKFVLKFHFDTATQPCSTPIFIFYLDIFFQRINKVGCVYFTLHGIPQKPIKNTYTTPLTFPHFSF